jgi:hypothetical protein
VDNSDARPARLTQHQDMRRGFAILFAIWATAACAAVDGNATAPTAAPSSSASSAPVAVVPEITPAPVGPPMRILWAPMQPQPLPVAVRVDPSTASATRVPALVPATPEQLQNAQRGFSESLATTYGLLATLQNLRDQKYNGSEEWVFATAFAPGPFADHVRELITTRRDNEIRTLHPGQATLEKGWVRPSSGPFGDPANVGLLEGTVTFTDEVATGAGKTIESHRWRIRALSQGQFFILDGVEGPADLAALPPFDPTTLDREVGAQVSAHLHTEEAGPQAMPMAPFQGTAYWNVRKGALDWLHELNARGTLTDRHFENVSAQVVRFTSTSYLGDGYVTVQLHGTLVETMNGARHTYPVNEAVMFQRFSFAQPYWIAVDGQNDDGTWIANGNYGTPQSTSHG